MPKFRVHLYPTFLIAIEAEAADRPEAVGKAVEKFFELLRNEGYTAHLGPNQVAYAENLDDTVHVDELDDQGQVIDSGTRLIHWH